MNPDIQALIDLGPELERVKDDNWPTVQSASVKTILSAIAALSADGYARGLEAENERLVKLVSAEPPVVIEPEIEKLLLRLETPTRENMANGTTAVYTPKPDVLWVCAAYRRLRALRADAGSEALRKALKPLVNAAEIFGKDWMDDDELAVTPFFDEDERRPPYIENNTLLFTLKVGDCRAAKALAASPSPGKWSDSDVTAEAVRHLQDKTDAAMAGSNYAPVSPAKVDDDEVVVATRRHWLPVGECKYCDDARSDSMMPYHDASKRCESGKHPHCTCDTCY